MVGWHFGLPVVMIFLSVEPVSAPGICLNASLDPIFTFPGLGGVEGAVKCPNMFAR